MVAGATSGCYWLRPDCQHRPLPPREHRAGAREVPPPSPAHADYELLRPFRSYLRLDHVEPLAHHFAVYYHCLEGNYEGYAVTRDPTTGKPRIELERAVTGPARVSAREVPPPPPEVRDLARAVRRHVATRLRHERELAVSYHGEYRVVVFSELVPVGMPGDPYQRGAASIHAELHASADLDRLIDERTPYFGGTTLLCWREWGPCPRPPRWFRFEPAARDGEAHLIELLRSPGRQSALAAERERLIAAALAAARAYDAGKPRIPVDALPVHALPLLPPDLDQRLYFGFRLYARPRSGELRHQQSVSLSTPLSVAQAAFGVAQGRAVMRIAGIDLTLETKLQAREPLPTDASGVHEVPMRLDLRLTDDQQHSRTVQLDHHCRLLVGGGRAGVLRFGPPDGKLDEDYAAQRHQELPGRGDFLKLDAYVEFGR